MLTAGGHITEAESVFTCWIHLPVLTTWPRESVVRERFTIALWHLQCPCEIVITEADSGDKNCGESACEEQRESAERARSCGDRLARRLRMPSQVR